MAKKDKATRLPKKVGGVKLPKQFRKSAGVVAELAQNPIAREVVSAALVAGATALAKRKVMGAAGQPATRKPNGEFDALIAQGKDVGNMLAQGVSAFFGALLKPAEDSGAAPHAVASAKPQAPKAVRATQSDAVKRTRAQPASTTPVAPKPRRKPAGKPKQTSTP